MSNFRLSALKYNIQNEHTVNGVNGLSVRMEIFEILNYQEVYFFERREVEQNFKEVTETLTDFCKKYSQEIEIDFNLKENIFFNNGRKNLDEALKFTRTGIKDGICIYYKANYKCVPKMIKLFAQVSRNEEGAEEKVIELVTKELEERRLEREKELAIKLIDLDVNKNLKTKKKL